MQKDNVLIATPLAVWFLICGVPLMAEDWPTRAGPHGDWTLKEKGLASEWPKEGPKLLWENKDIQSGFGSPVVVGGKVFVIDRPVDDKPFHINRLDEAKMRPGPDILHCLDRKTGKEIWKHEFNPLTNTGATAWNTPAVEGDVVYARGGDGQVRAISVKDGKSLWVWPKEGEKPYAKDDRNIGVTGGATCAASVTIVDDMLVMLGGHTAYYSIIVGLDKKTGAKVWEHFLLDWLHGANNYTVLTVGSRKTIAAFGELMDAKTGQKLCAYETSIGGMTFWCRTGKDNVLYSAYKRSQEQKFNHGEGLVCNRFDARPDGSITNTVLWKWKTPISDEQAQKEHLEKSFGGPLLVDGYLYVFMGLKGYGNSVECVDAATGKDAWPSRALNVQHGYISPIYVDGKIYYTDMAGTLSMFAADPKGYRPLGSAKVLDRAAGSPVISDGCLFSRGELGGLKCLDLRK